MLVQLTVRKVENGYVLDFITISKDTVTKTGCEIFTDESKVLDRVKELLSMQFPAEPVEPVNP